MHLIPNPLLLHGATFDRASRGNLRGPWSVVRGPLAYSELAYSELAYSELAYSELAYLFSLVDAPRPMFHVER